ncbi:MAG: hypothetical protein F2789_12220 [Actinobacteria bacterium]|nr:hypothetical protein [Actinomycetota bacterium]
MDFTVTAVLSAAFLNAVYNVLDGFGVHNPAIPVTGFSATIGAVSGATGAAVALKSSTSPAPTFGNPAYLVPAPTSLPLVNGVEVPLGHVVGSYTADASGSVSFGLVGNSWAPATKGATADKDTVADVLPDGVSEFGWRPKDLTTTPATQFALSTTGSQTFIKTALVSGTVTPYLICMGGTWTQGGTLQTPTFGAPLVPDTTGFGVFDISDGPPITEPVATTAPPTTPPTTTAPPTTTPGSTTPPTTAPGTTTPPTTPPTTIPAAKITGTASYTADCVDSLIGSHNTFHVEITASAMSPVAAGGTITVTDQEWRVTVPSSTVETLRPLLGATLDANSSGTLTATNTTPGSVTSPPLAVSVPLPAVGQDLVTVAHPDDASFTANGGNSVISFGGATQALVISDVDVVVTCTPNEPIPALLTVEVSGAQTPPADVLDALPTETITPDSSLTAGDGVPLELSGFTAGEQVIATIQSEPQVLGVTTATDSGVGSITVTLPAGLVGSHTLSLYAPASGHGGRMSVTITAAVPTATTLPNPSSNGGQIPGTGGNGNDLWVEVFGGLLVIQIGIMLWSAGQGRRRRRIA